MLQKIEQKYFRLLGLKRDLTHQGHQHIFRHVKFVLVQLVQDQILVYAIVQKVNHVYCANTLHIKTLRKQ